MIRVRLSIIGNPVQGVFFRAHAQAKAQELMVTGWVANDANGTVSAIVEGPKNQVTEFVDWCHSGPSTAHVEKVLVTEEPYSGEFEDFLIRY
jgi:acylphosphatase